MFKCCERNLHPRTVRFGGFFFYLPYCNSDSKIIQVILRFNSIVFDSTLAKKYTALNKENGESLTVVSSNIFAANGIFVKWIIIATILHKAKIYTALNKEEQFLLRSFLYERIYQFLYHG